MSVNAPRETQAIGADVGIQAQQGSYGVQSEIVLSSPSDITISYRLPNKRNKNFYWYACNGSGTVRQSSHVVDLAQRT